MNKQKRFLLSLLLFLSSSLSFAAAPTIQHCSYEEEMIPVGGLVKWFETECLPTLKNERPLFKIHYCGHNFNILLKDVLLCSTSIPAAVALCTHQLGEACLLALGETAHVCGLDSKELWEAAKDC